MVKLFKLLMIGDMFFHMLLLKNVCMLGSEFIIFIIIIADCIILFFILLLLKLGMGCV